MNTKTIDSRDFIIGVLAVTAAILLVGVVVVSALPQPALASEVSAYGGDFTISVGRVTRDTELVYVIDNTTERIVVYWIDRRNGVASVSDKGDLAKLAPESVP